MRFLEIGECVGSIASSGMMANQYMFSNTIDAFSDASAIVFSLSRSGLQERSPGTSLETLLAMGDAGRGICTEMLGSMTTFECKGSILGSILVI
jgi:hypothetical protein